MKISKFDHLSEESLMTDFRPGDVVRLISGGPMMTIERIFGDSAFPVAERGMVSCVWFPVMEGEFGPVAQRDLFYPAALELCPE